jgi:hypothetical protein
MFLGNLFGETLHFSRKSSTAKATLPAPKMAREIPKSKQHNPAPRFLPSVNIVTVKPAAQTAPGIKAQVLLFRQYGPGHGVGTLLVRRGGGHLTVVDAFLPVNPYLIRNIPAIRGESKGIEDVLYVDVQTPPMPLVEGQPFRFPSDEACLCHHGYEVLEIASSTVCAPRYRVCKTSGEPVTCWMDLTPGLRADLRFGQNHALKHGLDRFLTVKLAEMSKHTLDCTMHAPIRKHHKAATAEKVFQKAQVKPAVPVKVELGYAWPPIVWPKAQPTLEARPVNKGPARPHRMKRVSSFVELQYFVLKGKPMPKVIKQNIMATAKQNERPVKPVAVKPPTVKPAPMRVAKIETQDQTWVSAHRVQLPPARLVQPVGETPAFHQSKAPHQPYAAAV